MTTINFAAVAALVLVLASPAAPAASQCKLIKIAELPVRLVRNKMIVDGSVNGHKVGVMLDTGAMRTIVFRSAAGRLGLDAQWAAQYRMSGVGGESDVDSAVVGEFRLGEAVRRDWRMAVAGEHDFGDEVAVLLGDDFFHHVDVEFDLAHNVVRLFDPKDCRAVSLAYWAPRDASVVDIDAVNDARPAIIVSVQINEHPLPALVDSGAGASLLSLADAARVGLTPETPGAVFAGSCFGIGKSGVDCWIGPIKSFVIGDEAIRDTTIQFGELWSAGPYAPPGTRVRTPAMLLGADFLRSHRVFVAHSQGRLYFTYAGGPVFQRPAGPPGLGPAGASCQYNSECIGDLGCVGGKCQRFADSADRCTGHTECSRGEWCIGSPRRCQPRFAEGAACAKDADCEGALKCLRDRCTRPN